MDAAEIKELIKKAVKGRENSYSPYSGYAVGAALKTSDGFIFTGCNVENAAYGPGICAERVAMTKAVSEGHRKFEAIAVVGGKKGEALDMSYPCGTCRQVMREFADPEKFIVIVASSEDSYETYTLKEMLPQSFGPDNLA